MRRTIHWMLTFVLWTMLLTACGGGAPSTPRANQLLGGAVREAAAPSSAQWTFCANENGRCLFTGTQTVRYGAGDRYTSRNFDWAVSCDNQSFPDPAPGVAKHCEVTSSWTFCANENGQCTFADTETVRYGAGSAYYAQVSTGGANCGNGTFGDPAQGAAKHCDRAATTWTLCADEHGRCTFIGANTVLYGVDGKFTTKAFSNGTDCSNAAFPDPAPGAAKHCYLPGLPMTDGGAPPAPSGGSWNKLTTIKLENATRGAFADNQVYWALIGKDWKTDQFVRVDLNGNFIPIGLQDNNGPAKNGQQYTNYFHSLAEGRSVTITPLKAARLFLSVGTPMYIKVNLDINGRIGFTGVDLNNPSDPNRDVVFDFVELTINPDSGFFGNTTRVDQFGFPLRLRLQGLNGYDRSVGETETRDALFTAYRASVPAEFRSLADAPNAPYRIAAPANASFSGNGPNSGYLDGYINAIWHKYASQTLTFSTIHGTFSGRVSGDRLLLSDSTGSYRVDKPTTQMVLLGNGTLHDATGAAAGLATDKQLQIQAQLTAALNRHVADDPAMWTDSSYYYAGNQVANYYAWFWHQHSINQLAYGFSYDDVADHSTLLQTPAPTTATVTIGW